MTSELARREKKSQRQRGGFQVSGRASTPASGSRKERRRPQWKTRSPGLSMGFGRLPSRYDRLNLELSKLRQQLVQFQDRDSSRLALSKASCRSLPSDPYIGAAKRGNPASRAHGAFLKAHGRPGYAQRKADAVASQCATADAARRKTETQRCHTARRADHGRNSAPGFSGTSASFDSPPVSGNPGLTSPVLTILTEETVFTSAPKKGHGEGSDRPKILQEAVTANNAAEAPPPADSETKGNAQEREPPMPIAANGRHGIEDSGVPARDEKPVKMRTRWPRRS